MPCLPENETAPPTTLDVWSCNPADIPAWTEEDKVRLSQALAQIFGWPAAAQLASSDTNKA